MGEEQVEGDRGVEDGSEYGDLTARLNPEVPLPRITLAGEEWQDGWHYIDKLGAWDCFLCMFNVIQEIPHQFQAMWSSAWATVLEREAAAESDLAKERALKWLCFLSQGLLRTPRRGSRAGRGAIAKRFNALVKGDWGSLVTMWISDVAREREREQRRQERGRVQTRQQRESDEEARLKREVLHLISISEVGKAVSRMSSHGLAPMSDSVVRQQMAAKYPPREADLPDRVYRGEAVSNLRGLREGLKSLRKRRAPGAGGLRPEFLRVVGERMDGEQMKLLEDWSRRFLQGEMPPWFYVVWLSIQSIPLYKTDKKESIRPIGMRNPLSKLLNGLMIGESKSELVDYLEPQQLAMSQAGSARLVHCIRLLAEKELLVREERRAAVQRGEMGPQQEEMVGVKIDVKNAFNSFSAHSIITTLEEEDSLKHMAWAAACQLAPDQALESGGRMWGTRRTGCTQGDPAGSPYFCLSWHKWVRKLDSTLRAAGGLARFGMDDGYCWGPPSVLFPALDQFRSDIRDHCCLELEVSKFECFTWSGELPAASPRDIKLAGAEVAGSWEPGWVVYGCPMGTDAYTSFMLDQKVEEVARGAARACEVLEGESQALWAVLRLSIQQQFGYWISLVHPSQVAAAAERVDSILHQVLESVAGFSIPEWGEGKAYTCPLGPEVGWLEGRSFQSVLMGLPIKSGGLGIRSQLDLSPAAWYGALEQSVPFFSGEKAVCPPLADLSGYGEDDLHRWKPLLESGLRTGEELRESWATLQSRAQQMCDYLGEELGGALQQPVEAAGEGSTDGSTRMAITSQLEGLTLSVLRKHLEEHRDRTARPVCSMKQRDKMTTAWLLALPSSQGSLTSPIFQEGLAMVLCLPSPACKDRVGERIGRGRVDLWGDRVKCEPLPGNSWVHRHDRTKAEIMRMLGWSGIVATCEVTGLFQHLIPAAAMDRPDVRNQSHIMVPDYRIQLPSTTPGMDLLQGETVTRLAELKHTCSEQQYRTGVRQHQFTRAVDRRAGELMAEYQAKADRMDTLLGEEEGRGRIRRQLDHYGELITIVVGKYCELSDWGHQLLEAMACSRVAKQEQMTGLASRERAVEKGIIVGELRRQLSVINLRASMSCLLDRMHQCGEGGRLRNRRQEWMVRQEEMMREERELQWAGRVRGRNLLQPRHILRTH